MEHKKWIVRITLVLSIIIGVIGGIANLIRTLMVQVLMDGTGNPELIRKIWMLEEGLAENPVSFLIGFVICFGFTWVIYITVYWIIASIKDKKRDQPISFRY